MTDDQKPEKADQPVVKESVGGDNTTDANAEKSGDGKKATTSGGGSTSVDEPRPRARPRTLSPVRPIGTRQRSARLSPTRTSSSSRPSVPDQVRQRSFRAAKDVAASDDDPPKRPSLPRRAHSLKNFKPRATPVKAPIDLSGLSGNSGLDDSEKSADSITSRLSASIQRHTSFAHAPDAQSPNSQSSVASRLALSMNKHKSFRSSLTEKDEQSKATSNAQDDLSKRLSMSVQKSLSLRNATAAPVSPLQNPPDLNKRLALSVQKSLSQRNVKANAATAGSAPENPEDMVKRLAMSVQKSNSVRNLKANASPGISPSNSMNLSRGPPDALGRLALSVQKQNSLRNMNAKGALSSQTGSVLDLSLTDQLEIPQSSQNGKGETTSTPDAQTDLNRRLAMSIQKSLSLKNVKANVSAEPSSGAGPPSGAQDILNKRLAMSVQKSLSLRNVKANASPGISPSTSVDLKRETSDSQADFASRLSLSVQKHKSARDMSKLSGSTCSILDISLTDQLELPSENGKDEAKATTEAQDALNKRLAMSVQKSLSLKNVKANVSLDVSLTDQLEQPSGNEKAEAKSTTEAQDALNRRLAMSVQKSLSLKNMKANVSPALSPPTSVDLTGDSSDAKTDFASRLSLSVQKHKSARDMRDMGVLSGSESLLDVSLTDQLEKAQPPCNEKSEEASNAQASFSNRLALSVQKHKSARDVGDEDVSSSLSDQKEKPKETSASRTQDKRPSLADEKQDSKKDRPRARALSPVRQQSYSHRTKDNRPSLADEKQDSKKDRPRARALSPIRQQSYSHRTRDKRPSLPDEKQDSKKDRPRARALSPIRQQSYSHRRSRAHSPKREDSRSSLSSGIEKPVLRSSKSVGSREPNEGDSKSSSGGRPSLSPVRGGRPSLGNHFGKQRSFRHGKSRESDTQSVGDHLHDRSSRGGRSSLSSHFGKQRSVRGGKSKESSWDTQSDHLHKQRSSRSLSTKEMDALSPSSRGSRTSRNHGGGGLSGSLRGTRLSTSSRGSRTRRSIAQRLELPDMGDIPPMPDDARSKFKGKQRQEDCESTASLTVDHDELDDSCAGHSVASRGLVCSYRPDSNSDAELSSVGELSSDDEDAEMTQLDLGTPLASGKGKSKPTSPKTPQRQVNNMNGYFCMTDFLALGFGVVSVHMEYAQAKVHEGASLVIGDFSNSVDYMQATCEGWATSVGSILQSMMGLSSTR